MEVLNTNNHDDILFHFLLKIKSLLSQEGHLKLVDRDNCLGFITNHGFTLEEVKTIIMSLTMSDLIKGPEKDHNGEGAVWVFKKEYDGMMLYIKLKLESELEKEMVKLISFHEDE